MKESFIIYTSFYEPIKQLSDKQLGRIFRALFDYQLGNELQVDDDIKMAFLFFKNQIDIDTRRYINKVEANKQNGAKGGAPKGNNNARKKTIESDNDKNNRNNRNNPSVEKTTETTLNGNGNGNGNGNDNGNDNGNGNGNGNGLRDTIVSYCSEVSKIETPSSNSPPVISLILNDKNEYPIFEEQVQEWAELYPAVDVIQQLRNMVGWLKSNPTKRKTRRGILKFVTGWLAKAQDNPRGASNTQYQKFKPYGSIQDNYSAVSSEVTQQDIDDLVNEFN